MSSETTSKSRRKFIKSTLCLAAIPVSVVFTHRSAWADAPGDAMLAEDDPAAAALGYKEDATKVDTSKFPKRAGPEGAKQFCENCQLYRADEGNWGYCDVFPGKHVAAKGWCNAWVLKAG